MFTYLTRISSIVLLLFVISRSLFPASIAYAWNFQNILEESVTTPETANDNPGAWLDGVINISQTLEVISIEWSGSEETRDFIAFVAVRVIIPIFTIAGIIVAIIWFYRLMLADNEDKQKNGINWLLRWTVGVIVMVSAWFITNQLVGGAWLTGIFWQYSNSSSQIAWATIADEIYVSIFFPFLRVVSFLILGILFIAAVINGFKYIFSASDDTQQQALRMFIYTAMAIIVVILARSMVELVFWTYNDVIDDTVSGDGWWTIGDIGTWVFDDVTLFTIHTAINWVLWLASFIILLIIIIQGYQLLTQPTNEDTLTKLKKSIGYIFIGILVIGAGYILSNFFIIT